MVYKKILIVNREVKNILIINIIIYTIALANSDIDE